MEMAVDWSYPSKRHWWYCQGCPTLDLWGQTRTGPSQVHVERNSAVWSEAAESELREAAISSQKTATNGRILFLPYAPLGTKDSNEDGELQLYKHKKAFCHTLIIIIIMIIIIITIIITTTTTTLFHEGKNTLQLKTDEPVALYENVT